MPRAGQRCAKGGTLRSSATGYSALDDRSICQPGPNPGIAQSQFCLDSIVRTGPINLAEGLHEMKSTYEQAAREYLATHGGLGPASSPDAPDPRWSDGWLLRAIAMARRGPSKAAKLEDIFAAGDAINHAIFTHDELQTGFERLRAAGLISIESNQCLLTDEFDKIWKLASAQSRSENGRWAEVYRILMIPD